MPHISFEELKELKESITRNEEAIKIAINHVRHLEKVLRSHNLYLGDSLEKIIKEHNIDFIDSEVISINMENIEDMTFN